MKMPQFNAAELCPASGKVRFRSALKANRNILKRMATGEAPSLRAYKCPHCGDFHQTRQKERHE